MIIPHFLNETGGLNPDDFNQTHLQKVHQDFTGIEFPEQTPVNDVLDGPCPVHQIVDELLFGSEFLLQIMLGRQGSLLLSPNGLFKNQVGRKDLLLNLRPFIHHAEDIQEHLLRAEGEGDLFIALDQFQIKIEGSVLPPEEVVNRFVDLGGNDLQDVVFGEQLKFDQDLSQVFEGLFLNAQDPLQLFFA